MGEGCFPGRLGGRARSGRWSEWGCRVEWMVNGRDGWWWVWTRKSSSSSRRKAELANPPSPLVVDNPQGHRTKSRLLLSLAVLGGFDAVTSDYRRRRASAQQAPKAALFKCRIPSIAAHWIAIGQPATCCKQCRTHSTPNLTSSPPHILTSTSSWRANFSCESCSASPTYPSRTIPLQSCAVLSRSIASPRPTRTRPRRTNRPEHDTTRHVR